MSAVRASRRAVVPLLGLLALAAVAEADDAAALVRDGGRWWRESPDPGNPVACATCHDDHVLTRGWAASFPKVKPMPPPDTRVMTLLQANAAAVARHYRLSDPRPMATAITAYLAAAGADVPISPGMALGQPVFPERMRRLDASVERGGALFARACAGCHRAGAVAPLLRHFPRVRAGGGEALETFLEGHPGLGGHPGAAPAPLVWDGQETADVISYLTSRLAGQPAGLPIEQPREENP